MAVLLAACGDSDTPHAERTPSTTQTAATESSSTSTVTPTVTPTVAPAEGKPIDLPSLTGAFPSGWRVVDRTAGSNSAGDTNIMTGGFVFVSDLKNLGSEDFDEKVAIVLEGYAGDKKQPVRGENRAVDGVEGWVLEGASDGSELIYEFGTFLDGQDIHFTFSFQNAPKNAMEIVDSVLASVQWR
jgi:hypothetical protein